jgi:hypothetical protein
MAELDKALPEWNPCLQGEYPSADERWNRQLEQLLEHVRKHGHFPLMGSTSPREEYTLGEWIAVELYALKRATSFRSV